MYNDKIAVVGCGYVGNMMVNLFESHYEVYEYDLKFLNGRNDDDLKNKVNNCNFAFVCVPTPMNIDGSCNTKIVEDCIKWIESDIIIVKSTVSPGTVDFLSNKYEKNIVFSPEYVGMSSYWTPYKFHEDVKETPWFVFGGDKAHTSKCIDLYMKVCGPTKKYVQTSARAAEIAKYMENSFYATKVAFCHEFAEICRASGEDYNEVRELWLLDPRINKMHTAVFHDSECAFSGRCLPKDLNAIIKASEQNGYEPNLLLEVWLTNLRIGNMRKNRKQELNKDS